MSLVHHFRNQLCGVLCAATSVIAAGCGEHHVTDPSDGTVNVSTMVDDRFGDVRVWAHTTRSSHPATPLMNISIIEVIPSPYDQASDHFSEHMTSAAAMIGHGQRVVNLLGERRNGMLTLIDASLLIGSPESRQSLSLANVGNFIDELNNRAQSAPCQRVTLVLDGVGEVRLVLPLGDEIATVAMAASHSPLRAVVPPGVQNRVLREITTEDNGGLLRLAMLDPMESQGGRSERVGVAVMRATSRRFEGSVAEGCPWPTKRQFALHIAHALQQCAEPLETVSPDQLAAALNQSSKVQLGASQWQRLIKGSFGSLAEADAALCFLPEAELTPFVVLPQPMGLMIVGAFWLPIQWDVECDVHRYRCYAIPWPPDIASCRTTVNIWRLPSDDSGPRHFHAPFSVESD